MDDADHDRRLKIRVVEVEFVVVAVAVAAVDTARQRDLGYLCWWGVPVGPDPVDADKDARKLIWQVESQADMDDLRLDIDPQVHVAAIQDTKVYSMNRVLGCRYCLSQMGSPAVARTVNLDRGFSPQIHIGTTVQEVHSLPRGTWDGAAVVPSNLKGALEGNRVALSGDDTVIR